jgi:hypothetical protein
MIKKEKVFLKEVGFRAHCNTCENSGVHAYTTRLGLIEDMTRNNPFTGNWKFMASRSTKNPKAYCPTCIHKQTTKEKTK